MTKRLRNNLFAPNGARVAGPSRILLIEDEPLIAMMLEDALGELGREVTGVADSVASALPLIAAGGYDAAILDVNLRGGEKSWPLAAALAERGTPFVLATGGGDGSVIAEYRDRPVLPKPFTMDGVVEALDALPSTDP